PLLDPDTRLASATSPTQTKYALALIATVRIDSDTDDAERSPPLDIFASPDLSGITPATSCNRFRDQPRVRGQGGVLDRFGVRVDVGPHAVAAHQAGIGEVEIGLDVRRVG